MLKITNLVKKTSDDFSVQIQQLHLNSGIHHLIGPNGAGKSTLLDLVSGISTTTNQAITLLDIPITPFNFQQLVDIRRYLMQKQHMHFSLTVLEMLGIAHPTLNLDLTLNKEIIEGLDLENLMQRSVNQLSGGEVQRAQLARVFINLSSDKKYIILLDEPYTGLDIKHRFWLNKFLTTIQSFCCILISHHEINFALRSKQACILLNKGRLHALYQHATDISATELMTVFGIPQEAIIIENQGFKQINGI
ncbi:ABC transporter ATP-binding protein [Pseudoalteromonas tunicata]|jgi:ABC-type cobalamin transport system ATPase subunit|uniref:Vitamin B12-transporter ATPase n=1 Tax=Pseudoalteromonas tunicata D2 TaxID=87626 RepID=A4C3W3_9GAMM|nr:ABC transporter ATP-binding protein [Pseudoalteromonas tunicata]ATC97270.1 vitamin B12 transport system ATP-binding protein [Pseudoalteromonas tunicata]AXT33352.1 ABC transporter ATP-binding protein [Pseudoalteromonas tunicata]EAR30245.1 vitamin B12-transporter ATPase [Pseudoalteromonas tunicata D2]